MMDYVRQFQQKAGAIVGSHQPNRPALVLYFGDIAMRGRKALCEKLFSQIPANYHSAIVEGALCSSAEAEGLPCLSIDNSSAHTEFGSFAAAWRTPDQLLAAEQFLTALLQKTTEKPVAVTMAELDVYFVVGNDGGACELWPTVLELLSRPGMTVVAVKTHLVWMVRELVAYQQPRDLPMYRLLRHMENRNVEESAVAAEPEIKAIPGALEAWRSSPSITVVTDRNQTGVCSNDVWNASCEAVAGYMLAHMFSSHALPQSCTCAMYDAIYPDVFWSTGFQISAMLKLDAELQVRESARMATFQPMLAQAWGIPSVQSAEIIPLVSAAMPDTRDLYMLPVDPNADRGSLKHCSSVADAARLLFGDRFDNFFVDALENPNFEKLIEKLTDSLRQTVEQFARTNGVYAAAALLNERGDGSLPVLLQTLSAEAPAAKPLHSIPVGSVGLFQNPVAQRLQEVIQRGGSAKLSDLYASATRKLVDRLCAAMKKWKAVYQHKADALRGAFDAVNTQLGGCFSGVMLSYHQTIKQYADSKRLYSPLITDADFELLDHCFKLSDPAGSLLEALTKINVRGNQLITLSMQNAFTQLGYLNGANELKAALDAFCKAAVFSPVHYNRKEVFILPSEGDWSNGGRVYGLIRLYSAPDNVSLLNSISYLANLAGTSDLALQAGNPLPAPAAAPAAVSALPKEQIIPEEETAEEDKPLGKVSFNRPDSLITFDWPQGAELITMTLNGNTGFGERPYQQTLNVSAKNYLTAGGAILSNVRLTGRCEVNLSWYQYGQNFTQAGWLKVDPVHISRIITEKGKDYVVQITASENVPQLERYLMLQVSKSNGSNVLYRLPALVDNKFTISKEHCQGKPMIVFSDPKWQDYFSF